MVPEFTWNSSSNFFVRKVGITRQGFFCCGISIYPHSASSVSFDWEIERYTRGGMGINTYSRAKESLTSYSNLPDEEIAARIPCELRDHPLLIIPQEQRKNFLEKLIGTE